MPPISILPTRTGEADSSPSTRIERGRDPCLNHLLPSTARPVCLFQFRHHGPLCGPAHGVMEGIAGDVQVRGNGNGNGMERVWLWSQTGLASNLASANCSSDFP